ncbi:glycosyltransferase family 39 protein, partial [Patescibacteria group bacterium]|nr:glycosyltransferase family 39 protein [Patescibacteria group bacterium]
MSLIKKFRYEIIFFLVFCLARAPFLGNELFNTDVWKWKARIYDFGSGVFQLDFNKTLQKYHPGVTLMWLGTTAIKFQGLYCAIITCPDEAINPTEAVFALHFFQKLFVVVAIGLILTVTFYPLRMLFGKRYAYVTLFLLSFEPFFYALTRVIHLEGLMTALMLASFVWLFYSLEKTQEKRQQIAILPVALSAIFGGLAILTKSSALFLVPFSLGVLFYYQNKNRRQALRLVVVWVSLVVATYFTLWPSMWVQPLKTLDYVFVRGIMETGLEGEHGQIFLRQYTENPGPAYYLVIAGYKFSPFLVTGIMLFLFRKKDIFASFGGEKAKRFAL